MVKHIKLDIDEKKFYALKQMKTVFESAQKENMTWEDFLVDRTLEFNDWIIEKGIDKALEEAYSQIKPERRKEFETLVKTVIVDKMRYNFRK